MNAILEKRSSTSISAETRLTVYRRCEVMKNEKKKSKISKSIKIKMQDARGQIIVVTGSEHLIERIDTLEKNER